MLSLQPQQKQECKDFGWLVAFPRNGIVPLSGRARAERPMFDRWERKKWIRRSCPAQQGNVAAQKQDTCVIDQDGNVQEMRNLYLVGDSYISSSRQMLGWLSCDITTTSLRSSSIYGYRNGATYWEKGADCCTTLLEQTLGTYSVCT